MNEISGCSWTLKRNGLFGNLRKNQECLVPHLLGKVRYGMTLVYEKGSRGLRVAPQWTIYIRRLVDITQRREIKFQNRPE